MLLDGRKSQSVVRLQAMFLDMIDMDGIAIEDSRLSMGALSAIDECMRIQGMAAPVLRHHKF
jgi:hypothetical protein